MKNFSRMIQIRDNKNEYRDAMALLDTQCDGNWISTRLVDRLCLGNTVVDQAATVTRNTPCGRVSASTTITPTWRFQNALSIRDECEFFIFQDTKESRKYDVLLGKQYIVKEDIFTINDDKIMSVLSRHEDIKLCKSCRDASELNITSNTTCSGKGKDLFTRRTATARERNA